MRIRMLLVTVAGALLLCSAVPAHGQSNWRGMQTDNFYLVGDASPRAMRRVADQLETFRAAFLTVRPRAAAAISDTDTTVVVFDSDQDFRPYKPLAPDGGPANLGGFFVATNYDVYIALTGEREAEQTIYHEYVHRVSSEDRSWPAWLREGVAEFYSTIQVRNGGETVRVGIPIDENLRLLQNTRLIPLDEFLDIGTDPLYYLGERDQGRFYAQSWALTHYLLLQRPGGSDQLLRFLELLDSGGDTATNFRTAFQTDFDSLSRELDLYVRNSVTLPALDYRLEVRLEDAGRWNAEDISEAEANYHLGELLSRVDRVDDARVYLEAAIDQAPNMVQPVTRIGILYEMEGDVDTAFEYFERAAEMEAAGYLPRLLYAERLLFRNGYSDREEVETATQHLRRAVALRPESVRSLQRLGEVLLSDPETTDEALDVLSRAVRLDRGNPRLTLSYLRALWRSGQTESAREGTEALAGATTDPEVRRGAEALLEDIERFGDPTRFTATGDITPQPEARPNLARSDNVSSAGADADPVLPGNTSIVPEGMEQVSGRLTLMDCSGDGVRFRVDSEEQTLWFAAADAEAVSFVSFSSEIRDSIACGEFSPPLAVRITYDPEFEGGDSRGNPVVVEFLPE